MERIEQRVGDDPRVVEQLGGAEDDAGALAARVDAVDDAGFVLGEQPFAGESGPDRVGVEAGGLQLAVDADEGVALAGELPVGTAGGQVDCDDAAFAGRKQHGVLLVRVGGRRGPAVGRVGDFAGDQEGDEQQNREQQQGRACAGLFHVKHRIPRRAASSVASPPLFTAVTGS